ncbi:2Fe-2S iron-sulfur cluster-binding domain protein [Bacteriovorax sp. DB6_IX]|nr:2Fe-2S iron-sulfur cluster-binding domain protein [Bacteriovorax sp. DB6_IX]
MSVVELDADGNEIPGSEKSFQVDTGDVIFDSLDNQGHKLPHGCLAGSCGSCRILVLEGAENLAKSSVIEANTVDNIAKDYREKLGENFVKDKTIRLSCRARLKEDGPVKIGALKS